MKKHMIQTAIICTAFIHIALLTGRISLPVIDEPEAPDEAPALGQMIEEKPEEKQDGTALQQPENNAAPGSIDQESGGEAMTSLGVFKVTGYTPHEDAYGRRTASGAAAQGGVTVAVDPSVIPLGSMVYIEGVGYRTAQDTGGLVKGKVLDLFFETNEEMHQWGRQYRQVYIVNHQ